MHVPPNQQVNRESPETAKIVAASKTESYLHIEIDGTPNSLWITIGSKRTSFKSFEANATSGVHLQLLRALQAKWIKENKRTTPFYEWVAKTFGGDDFGSTKRAATSDMIYSYADGSV